mmetsp:Transcript_16447/g.41861  ORF Transcript_16447/g.41861 Transcript_16447/m.41861 type:complete len:230 (+) Transcript_16447:1886-2575(+)
MRAVATSTAQATPVARKAKRVHRSITTLRRWGPAPAASTSSSTSSPSLPAASAKEVGTTRDHKAPLSAHMEATTTAGAANKSAGASCTSRPPAATLSTAAHKIGPTPAPKAQPAYSRRPRRIISSGGVAALTKYCSNWANPSKKPAAARKPRSISNWITPPEASCKERPRYTAALNKGHSTMREWSAGPGESTRQVARAAQLPRKLPMPLTPTRNPDMAGPSPAAMAML